jgi:hypothetical protein
MPKRASSRSVGIIVSVVTMRAGVVSCAAVLVLVTSGCGGGEGGPRAVSRLHLTDPVGDVLLPEAGNTYLRSQTVRNADLIAADLRRTRHFLRIRLTYRDLSPFGSSQWGVSFNVSTSGGSDRGFTLGWERGQWRYSGKVGRRVVQAGDWYQGVHLSAGTSEDGGDSPCDHPATAQVDYATATLNLRLASRCLNHDPTWMRVDDLATYSTPPGPRGHLQSYGDNPFNSTVHSESTPRLVAPHG